MQIQDSRQTAVSADSSAANKTRQSFARSSLSNRADAFAEVFQTLAAATVPKQKTAKQAHEAPNGDASSPVENDTDKVDSEQNLADTDTQATTESVAANAVFPQSLPTAPVVEPSLVASDKSFCDADAQVLKSDAYLHDQAGNHGTGDSVDSLAGRKMHEHSTSQVAAPINVSPVKPQSAAANRPTPVNTQPVEATHAAAPVSDQSHDPQPRARDLRERRSKSNGESRPDSAQSVSPADRQLDAVTRSQQTNTANVSPVSKDDPLATAPEPSNSNSPAPVTTSAIVANSIAGPATPNAIQSDKAAASANAKAVSGTSTISGTEKTVKSPAETNPERAKQTRRQVEIADRARLVHRIANAFQRLGIDGGHVRLKMHPDELGAVQLEMHVSGRKIKATVIADSDEAKKLLQANLPDLRQRLESQGMTVERIEVSTRGDASQTGLSNHQSSQSGSYHDDNANGDGAWTQRTERQFVSKSSNDSVSKSIPARTAVAGISSVRSLDLKG